MAYPKRSMSHYILTGGVNQKASSYATSPNQAYNLRNLDFFVPGAVAKTPGWFKSYVGSNGPTQTIKSLFYFNAGPLVLAGDKLVSQIGISWTQYASGLTNSIDFLRQNTLLYMANGSTCLTFDGVTIGSFYLPSMNFPGLTLNPTIGAVGYLPTFMGVTVPTTATVFFTYTYVKIDGALGPIQNPSFNGVTNATLPSENNHAAYAPLAATYPKGFVLSGFTAPQIYGVSGFAIFAQMATFVVYYTTGAGQVSPLASEYRYLTTIPASTATFVVRQEQYSYYEQPKFQGIQFDFNSTYIPKYLEVNYNALFASGFSSSPNRIWFSEPVVAPGDANFLPTNFVDVISDDSDYITGIKSYLGTMVVFKNYSFFKIVGQDADNYQIVPVSQEYGCIRNECVVEFKDQLVFLDRKGIVLYNGASWKVISDAIEPTIFSINWNSAVSTACAEHYQYRKQIWFSVPVNGATTNNLIIVWDYELNAWSFIDGVSATALNYPQSIGEMFVGTYSGPYGKFSPSFYDYNGVPFTCIIETVFDSPDGFDVTNMFRRLFLNVTPDTSGATGVINVEAYADYNRSSALATFAIYQNSFQTRADFGVQAKAIAFKMSYSHASLPLTINGYDVQRRFLRQV